MKAVVAAFNQEKALVGAFSVITNLRMELFQALLQDREQDQGVLPPPRHPLHHHPDRVLLHRRQVSTSGYQPRVPTCVCPGRGSARSRVPGTRPRAPRTPRAWRTAAARTSPPSWRSCPSCEAVLNITQI